MKVMKNNQNRMLVDRNRRKLNEKIENYLSLDGILNNC